ncbi:unnamed protein product [Fusarium graminearum]|uniref:Uncharacterized protein n=1 Tax=Gibberella zeae TaxID=5518 RepID=A0A4E9D6I3_GIBZA|nr:unnamed protein product [Fusarium graminearum]CAF3535057.1 unnamed protein product [Fusarium graminearum]CAG1975950.1 unnamed protein product [Fusarium graminearum]CAG1983265.1 unnamed protein product [Fusarium graminearum]
MPGVPKSRGCNNCLKQKKKGSGERKYVFKSVSFTKLRNASLRKLRKKESREVTQDCKNEGDNIEK